MSDTEPKARAPEPGQSSEGPAEGRRRASIGAKRNPEAEEAIIAAARALLAERGYAGFSIEEVARRAGAGKPTIYRWWPSKADLFIEVYSTEKATSIAAPDTGALWRDILLYTRALWAFWRDTPSGRTFRALIAEAQASEAALTALREKFLPDRLKDMRLMFDRAVARGEIAAETVNLRIDLYVGFNWVRLLTSRLEDESVIEQAARLIAGTAVPQ